MSVWKRAMDYLGLGPDDAYDDYDMPLEPEPAPRPSRASYEPDQRVGRPPAARGGGYGGGFDDDLGVRPVSRPTPMRDPDPIPARPRVTFSEDSGVVPRPARQGSAVRSVPPPSGEPYTVRPRHFNQAQEVADKFKEGLPVIMNLEGTEREVSRRLIDFASGLCYALDGAMEKVATGVYLLKPPTGRDY